MDTFDYLDELLSLENGYIRYRRHIASIHPNLIPFMAPLLRDIRHIYDGNPRPVSKDELNYELIVLLGKVFLEVGREGERREKEKGRRKKGEGRRRKRK